MSNEIWDITQSFGEPSVLGRLEDSATVLGWLEDSATDSTKSKPKYNKEDVKYYTKGRTLLHDKRVQVSTGKVNYAGDSIVTEEKMKVDTEDIDKATLISSKLTDKEDKHKPVIDIDLPIEVYPSSQLGHYHLYIDKEMDFDEYMVMLSAMASAGVVEEGYVAATKKKGYSSIRPPGVAKPTAPRGSDIIQENSKLRMENNILASKVHALEELLGLLDQETDDKLEGLIRMGTPDEV